MMLPLLGLIEQSNRNSDKRHRATNRVCSISLAEFELVPGTARCLFLSGARARHAPETRHTFQYLI